MTPRRRLAPEARRQELLDAALTVIAERGAEARVEDVVRAAGAAKGTFYLYFPSWQDLLTAAREQLMAEFRAGMSARLAATDADWWTKFLDELTFFVDFLLAMGPLHEAIFHGSPDAPVTRGQDAPGLIAAMLRDGIGAGAVVTDDPDTMGVLVFELAHGAADAIQRGEDRDRTIAGIRELLQSGLAAP